VTVDGYNRNAQRMLVAGEGEVHLGAGLTASAEFNYARATMDSSFEGHPFQSKVNLFGGREATSPVDNPFAPYTPAMAGALSTRSTSVGANSLNNSIVSASGSGSQFTLPAGEVRAVLGAEQRGFLGNLGWKRGAWRANWNLRHIGRADFAGTNLKF